MAHVDDDYEAEIAAKEAEILKDLRRQGVRMAGDMSIPEAIAEQVLGLSRGALGKRYTRGTLAYDYRVENNRRWYTARTLARAFVDGKRRQR